MTALTLAQASLIVDGALKYAHENGLKPLAIAVLDARGVQKFFLAQDGTSLRRGEIALGKANGAIALGVGPRTLNKMALDLSCRSLAGRWSAMRKAISSASSAFPATHPTMTRRLRSRASPPPASLPKPAADPHRLLMRPGLAPCRIARPADFRQRVATGGP
jgi:uncharacterized protein GlcG (DUF336 family)